MHNRLGDENLLAVNVLRSWKNSLRKVFLFYFFIILTEIESEKVTFNLGLRFKDCLITHWLPTTSILVVIERIYRYQFKSIYLKNHPSLSYFYLVFGMNIKFPMLWKKMRLLGQVFLNWLTPKDVLI